MSVSDIVVLEDGDSVTAHYCDDVGFKDVTSVWFAEHNDQENGRINGKE